jgi:hypothetical protein
MKMDDEHEPTYFFDPKDGDYRYPLRGGWWRYLTVEEINESIDEAVARLNGKEPLSRELGMELYDVVAVKLKDRNSI